MRVAIVQRDRPEQDGPSDYVCEAHLVRFEGLFWLIESDRKAMRGFQLRGPLGTKTKK